MSNVQRYYVEDRMGDGSCICSGGSNFPCGFRAAFSINMDFRKVTLTEVTLLKSRHCMTHRENDPAVFQFAKENLPNARQAAVRTLEAV